MLSTGGISRSKMKTIPSHVAVFIIPRLRPIVSSTMPWMRTLSQLPWVFCDEALENSFADAVQQYISGNKNLSRRCEARVVKWMTIEVRDEGVVEEEIRCTTVNQA